MCMLVYSMLEYVLLCAWNNDSTGNSVTSLAHSVNAVLPKASSCREKNEYIVL